jgi:hypothetical protein
MKPLTSLATVNSRFQGNPGLFGGKTKDLYELHTYTLLLADRQVWTIGKNMGNLGNGTYSDIAKIRPHPMDSSLLHRSLATAQTTLIESPGVPTTIIDDLVVVILD